MAALEPHKKWPTRCINNVCLKTVISANKESLGGKEEEGRALDVTM